MEESEDLLFIGSDKTEMMLKEEGYFSIFLKGLDKPRKNVKISHHLVMNLASAQV
jgi:hypothetical protein